MLGGVKGDIVYPNLSYKIVGILYDVYNELGYGYKEIIYQKAIEKELFNQKIRYISQAPYLIKYKGKIIGRRYLDFMIDDRMILEIKRGDYFVRQNLFQVLEYLKITNLKLALLANFTLKGVKCKRVLNIK